MEVVWKGDGREDVDLDKRQDLDENNKNNFVPEIKDILSV